MKAYGHAISSTLARVGPLLLGGRGGGLRTLREEQYGALLRYVPVNIAVNLVVGAVLVAVFAPVVPGPFLYAWYGGVVAVSGGRGYILMRSRAPNDRSAHGWPFVALTLSSIAAGGLWGLVGAWLMPLTGPAGQIFIAITTSALVGGSATTLAPVPLAAWGFTLSTTLPIAAYFASVGEAAYTGLAFLATFFGCAMAYTTHLVYRRFREHVRIRLESEALVSQLAKERAQWLELSANAEAFALFDADDRLVLSNPRFERALSLPPGIVTPGARCADLLRAGVLPSELLERRHAFDNWFASLTPPPSGVRAPISYRMSNGRWLRTSAYRTASGGRALLLVDVTDLKTQELAFQAAQNELAVFAQEKKEAYAILTRKHGELKVTLRASVRARDEAIQAVAAKTEFLTGLSHEFRTPLNTIIGASEVIAQEMFGPLGVARYKSYAEDIREAGHQLGNLANQVGDLANLETGRLTLVCQPVDLESAVAGSCLQIAHALASADISLNVDHGSTPWPTLEADEVRLKQILISLLSHAAKFTPPGGRIALRVRPIGSSVWFVVGDTGSGTPPEMNPLIPPSGQSLEAVETKRMGGLLLGLPVAKSLIELHGGTLKIRTQSGRGTVIAAIMPARPIVAASNHEAPRRSLAEVVPLR